MSQPTVQTQHEGALPPTTHVGVVTLTIANLDRSLQFYEQVLGFRTLERTPHQAVLGVSEERGLLVLVEQEGAHRQPPSTTGLYHFAILVPSRIALGRSLARLAQARYPLGGSSDHFVSEALYLDDLDGNGIEIYRDRPRENWQWQQGQIRMGVEPLDLNGLLAGAEYSPSQWQGLPEQTIIGHIHLRVADLDTARHFYADVLGFAVTAHLPGALFVSAGHYHHHIGLNTWQSRGAPPPPADSVGLRYFTVQLPDQTSLEHVQIRLQETETPFERREQVITLHDPWHNRLLLSSATLTPSELLHA